MAYIVKNKQDMATMLELQISRLKEFGQSTVMLMLPVLGCETWSETVGVLYQQKAFKHKSQEDDLPCDCLGTINFSRKRTAYDALQQLSQIQSAVISRVETLSEIAAAMDCAVEQPIEGKTLEVSLPAMQSFHVDVEAFAFKTGLPLRDDSRADFAVYLHILPDPARPEQKRRVIVAVAGEIDWSAEAAPADSLDGAFPILEKLAPIPSGVFCDFTAKGMHHGWQLRRHQRFSELLGLLRPGHSYFVIREEDGLFMVF